MASYNVHAWMGIDGRRDPARAADVLEEIGADVVALQEVRCSGDDRSALEALALRLRASAVRGLVLDRADGRHGNSVLSRLPVGRVDRIDLTVRSREPRGAIDLSIQTGEEPLRLIATHLGIGPRERRLQVRRLVEALAEDEQGVRVLLGDMNEWVRGFGALLPLHRLLGRAPGLRTFPAALPLFSLDRIWVAPRWRLGRIWVHRSSAARRASDHLPIVAEILTGSRPGVALADKREMERPGAFLSPVARLAPPRDRAVHGGRGRIDWKKAFRTSIAKPSGRSSTYHHRERRRRWLAAWGSPTVAVRWARRGSLAIQRYRGSSGRCGRGGWSRRGSAGRGFSR